MDKPLLLKINGISKRFAGVQALNKVDFCLHEGEVHVLVGENGAGKSTLAKCILGIYHAEEGEIYLDGKLVSFRNPEEALKQGIAAVYQELTLVPYLNAAQNIFLNREPRLKSGLIDNKKMTNEAKKYLDLLGCHIDMKVPVKKLDVAAQQMIEIAKALSFNPRIIIFDEPTSSLSEREIDALFDQIHILKKRGIGIIYVSHRMQEYHRIGDTITVLRDGKFIKTLKVGELNDEQLVNLMVGRDISQVYNRTKNNHGGVMLKTDKLCDVKGRVNGCSIEVKSGEIVGLMGLVGAGRTELARLIYGIDKISSGRVYLKGEEITGKPPYVVAKKGLGFLPEDRKRFGLAINSSIAWNIVAVALKTIFPSGFTSEKKNIAIAEDYKKKLNIVSPDVVRPVRNLSGGNQQKVVIAKWLLANPNVIIFDEPTRGIDVGAKMEIYELMDKLASNGAAILMISSEMQEVIGMSDRIYIMKDGQIIDEIKRGEKTQEEIGRIMVLGGANI